MFSRQERGQKWELLANAVTDHIARIRGPAPNHKLLEMFKLLQGMRLGTEKLIS